MKAAVLHRLLCCSLPSTVYPPTLAWIPPWATVPQGHPRVSPSWASSFMGVPASMWILKCYGGYFYYLLVLFLLLFF